jgi:threonine dehydratase
MQSQGDSLRLSVLTERDPRYAQQTLRQVLSFSDSDIIQVERQVFSGRRTALLSAGAVGLLALLISQWESSGGDPGPSTGPDPGSPAVRIGIPIFR